MTKVSDEYLYPKGNDVIVHTCEWCGGEIYEGELCYSTNQGYYHNDDCLDGFITDYLDAQWIYAERAVDYGEND